MELETGIKEMSDLLKKQGDAFEAFKTANEQRLAEIEKEGKASADTLKTISDFRNYAIVNLMLRTGMRRCEVVRMNVEDIMIANNIYQLQIQRKGRTTKDQTITLDKAIVDPIQEYLSLRNIFADSSPVFINHSRYNINQRINEDYISRLAKESMRRIGIDRKDMTCHSFRHTAAITAIKAKALPYEVQQMLGHRSGSTTEIYFKAAEAEELADHIRDVMLGE